MLNEKSLQVSQNRLGALTRAIGVHPGEGVATALLFGQSFGLGMMLFAMFTAANSLFLAEFGAQALPYIYIVAAIVNVGIGFGFTRLQRQLSFSRLLVSTLIFLAASILLLRLGLGLTGTDIGSNSLTLASVLVFTLAVWLRLVWVVGNLVLWALAGRLFDVRQSKRLFTLILAGAVFAIIISGLLISPLIELIGPANLLFIAAGCLIAVLGLLLLTINKFRDQLERKDEDVVPGAQPQKYWNLFLHNRFFLLIFAYTIISTLGSYFLDFAFFVAVRDRYTDLNSSARFLGNYISIVTLAMLIVSLAVGPLLSRYGVKFGLGANPAVVLVGTVIVALALSVFGPVAAIFWLVVFTKASDEILISATSNTSIRILYQSVPTSQQVPLQTAVESIVTPLSMGLAGVFLLLFRAVGINSALPVIYLLLITLAGWNVVSLFLNRAYGRTLIKALTQRRFKVDAALELSDKSSRSVIEQALTHEQAEVAIYAFTLLEQNDSKTLIRSLPALLKHPQAEVRLVALQAIEDHRLTAAEAQLRTMLGSEEDPALKGAELRALAAVIGPGFVGEAEPYLNSADPTIRRESMIGLLRYGGLEGVLVVGQKLLHLIDSPNTAERVLAAQVLCEGQLVSFYHPLERLLQDDDVRVRQTALRAAGQLQNPALWPLVAQGLTTPETRQPAMDALIKGGPSTLPVLLTLFDGPNTENNLRKDVARIVGRIGAPEAISFLRPYISFPDQAVRTEILFSLSHCHYQADETTIPDIRARITAEVSHSAWLLAAMIDIGAEDGAVTLLREALNESFLQSRDRVFYLLSFIYDSQVILQARLHLTTSSAKQAYAMEVLDVLLNQEMKRMIFPLIDASESLEQRLARLDPIAPQARLSRTLRLSDIIGRPQTELNRWVCTCAVYAAGTLRLEALTDPIRSTLGRPDLLLQETAAQALNKIDPQLTRRLLSNGSQPLPDPVRSVIKRVIADTQGEYLMLSTIERVLFLRSAEIFNQLSGEALVWVAQVAQELQLRSGERFIQQGDAGDCLYIIVTGRVDVTLDGGKKIDSHSEKGVIGEMALFSMRQRMANCIAATDTTLLRINREDFHALLSERSELALGVIGMLADRLEDAKRYSL